MALVQGKNPYAFDWWLPIDELKKAGLLQL
jgi:hypothetical protein